MAWWRLQRYLIKRSLCVCSFVCKLCICSFQTCKTALAGSRIRAPRVAGEDSTTESPMPTFSYTGNRTQALFTQIERLFEQALILSISAKGLHEYRAMLRCEISTFMRSCPDIHRQPIGFKFCLWSDPVMNQTNWKERLQGLCFEVMHDCTSAQTTRTWLTLDKYDSDYSSLGFFVFRLSEFFFYPLLGR